MIYLIGGPPRVGKTKVVDEVLSLKPMHCLSTDAVRHMLRKTLSSTELPEELVYRHSLATNRTSQQILDSQNAESRALWPYLIQLMDSYNIAGLDLLLEGVAVLPELVVKLKFPYKCLMIGNNSLAHLGEIVEQAKSDDKDWLHEFPNAEIEAYGEFFKNMSEWIQAEAQKYDLSYMEINGADFHESIQKAAKALIS